MGGGIDSGSGPTRTRAELEAVIAELEQDLRSRDEFIAIAAHELRNPMMPILLSVQSLRLLSERAGSERPAQLEERLASLEKRVHHFVRRASTLLDVSRIASGHARFELEPVDLTQLTRESVESHSDELHSAGCQLTLELAPEVTGSWDRVAVEQVIMNLLSNAVKYGAGAPIAVSLTADTKHATLTVRDHGVGISEDAQQRLFQKFERAVKRSEYGGFGIGLWITRQTVEGLGGRIEVHSIPGAGSTFTVTLPRGLRENDER